MIAMSRDFHDCTRERRGVCRAEPTADENKRQGRAPTGAYGAHGAYSAHGAYGAHGAHAAHLSVGG